jgi:hypothetical protein
MFRQTLCGSPDQYYALISHSFVASPSYFVTAALNQYLFQSWFTTTTGHRDLAVVPVNSSSSLLRAYSFVTFNWSFAEEEDRRSANGTFLTLLLLNLDTTAANVSIATKGLVPENASLYQLLITSSASLSSGASVEDLLGAPQVALNGFVMLFDDVVGVSPSLNASLLVRERVQRGDEVTGDKTPVVLVVVPPVSVVLYWMPWVNVSL